MSQHVGSLHDFIIFKVDEKYKIFPADLKFFYDQYLFDLGMNFISLNPQYIGANNTVLSFINDHIDQFKKEIWEINQGMKIFGKKIQRIFIQDLTEMSINDLKNEVKKMEKSKYISDSIMNEFFNDIELNNSDSEFEYIESDEDN